MASYRPTPLERAYASHLLSTHFATPFDPNSPASEDDAETIRVPGRNAVPFLTTSGVERSLLRLLWQAADPDGVGTLTKRSQVYTLLRFVAMAQAHFLPPLRGEMGDEDKLQLLRETLQSNSHLVVALPTFGADQPPSVAHLMGTYPPPKEASSFSAAADHDFQYQMFMKQQSDSTAANTMAGAATGEDRTMSVSDAFGSMGEVEDRPLAPLQATPVLEEPDGIEKEGAPEMPVLEDGGVQFAGGEGEEFGTFDSVPAPPMDETPAPEEDNFGAFDSVPAQEMGTGQLETQATGIAEADPAEAATQPARDEEEDFGGFAGAADGPSEDEFGGFSDVPDVQNEEAEDAGGAAADEIKTESEEAKEEGDTFGDFDQAPTDSTDASLPPLGTGAPTLSISDAFGSLVEQDQGMGTGPPPPEVTDVEEDGTGDDDDFGDFSGTGGTAVDDADPTHAHLADGEEIKSESEEPSAPNDDKLSAFDSLVEVEDAPLPTLGAFSAGKVDAKDDKAEDDDGFGDFADHSEEAEEKEGQEDDFGDFEKIDKSEVPSPDEAAAIAGGEPEDGMAPTPAPAAAPLLPSTEGEETPAAAGLSHVDSGSEKISAFDALTEVQDTPLPPPGSFAVGNDMTEPVAVDQEANEDSFGDFADPVPTEESTGEGKPDAKDTADKEAEGADFGSGQSPADVDAANIEEVASEHQTDGAASAFDAFSDVEDAPLPPLGSFAVGNGVAEPVSVDGEAAEDSFCDFASPEEVSDTLMDNPDAGMEDAPEIRGEEAGVQIAEDNFASAFDVLGETQDAPLPSLDAFAPAADAVTSDEAEMNEDDNMFGDFEGTAEKEASNATETVSSVITPIVDGPGPDASFDAFASSNAPSDANDNEVFAPEQETASNQPAMLDAFEKVPPPPLVVGNEGENAEPKADEHKFGISEGDTVVQHNTGGFEAFPAAGLGAGEDVFGDFTAPQSYVQGASPPGDNEAQADDDEFGDFAGQEFTEPPSDNNLSVEPKANEQAFGDVEGDTVIAHNLTEGFEAFPAATSGFGAEGEVFGGLSYVQGEAAGDSANAAAIESNPGDVGEGFGDFSSFDETTPQPESDKDVRLAELLRSQLGDEFGRLPADWKDVILSAVEKDLQRANKVMDDLSNTLSPKDRALVVKSKKLREHVLGLAEFVRIVRSIAATIGDLLGVSKDVDVQEATLSQWHDNEIIADAIVIEYLWSEICSKAVGLGILSEAPPLETVVEIRAGAPPINARQKDEICRLTLQPLGAGGTSTRSPVEWKGKQYTACAANFCLNRVPEYAM